MSGTIRAICRFDLHSLVWRAFWAAMIVSHLGATYHAVFVGDASGWRAAALAASQVFFVLKLLDVPWLRLPSDRRTRVALVALFALLHGRVLAFDLSHGPSSSDTLPMVVLSGGIATAYALASNLLCRRPSPPRQPVRVFARRTPPAWRVDSQRLSGRCRLLPRAAAPNRAPPA